MYLYCILYQNGLKISDWLRSELLNIKRVGRPVYLESLSIHSRQLVDRALPLSLSLLSSQLVDMFFLCRLSLRLRELVHRSLLHSFSLRSRQLVDRSRFLDYRFAGGIRSTWLSYMPQAVCFFMLIALAIGSSV